MRYQDYFNFEELILKLQNDYFNKISRFLSYFQPVKLVYWGVGGGGGTNLESFVMFVFLKKKGNDWLLSHLKFMCLFIKVFNLIVLNLFWFKFYHYFWMFKNIQHSSIDSRIYNNLIIC